MNDCFDVLIRHHHPESRELVEHDIRLDVVVVSSPSWYEAKRWAARTYPDRFVRVKEALRLPESPDVELSWEGSAMHWPSDLRIVETWSPHCRFLGRPLTETKVFTRKDDRYFVDCIREYLGLDPLYTPLSKWVRSDRAAWSGRLRNVSGGETKAGHRQLVVKARMQWMSKTGRSDHVAHLIAEGAPMCSRVRLADGSPALAPFRCDWTSLRPEDHPCVMCRRQAPSEFKRTCACFKCR